MNFKAVFILGLILLGLTFSLSAHNVLLEERAFINQNQGFNWDLWIGKFHPVILHFPIALIVTTVAAELLYLFYPHPMFANASRFMILTAAIMVIPTVITGLEFSEQMSTGGVISELLWWHRLLGFLTAGAVILTALFRELYTAERIKSPAYYIIFLMLSFILINMTSFVGGEMSFGPFFAG